MVTLFPAIVGDMRVLTHGTSASKHCMVTTPCGRSCMLALHDACLVVQVRAAIACAEGVDAVLVCELVVKTTGLLQAG